MASDTPAENPPGFGVTLFTILLPVALTLLRTLADITLDEGNQVREWTDFIGEPVLALLVGVLVALLRFGSNAASIARSSTVSSARAARRLRRSS